MVVGVAVCRDARHHAFARVDVDVTRAVDRSVACASTYGILMLWVRVTTRAGSRRIETTRRRRRRRAASSDATSRRVETRGKTVERTRRERRESESEAVDGESW